MSTAPPRDDGPGAGAPPDRPYDPYDRQIRACPYPWFQQLAGSECPVIHHVLAEADRIETEANPLAARPTLDFFLVFSHALGYEVLRDHERFSSQGGTGPERALIPEGGGVLINADPPQHGRHRQILINAISPRMLRAREPRMREIAAELVDGFADRGEGDLVPLFTRHFPGLVFAEILGVDTENQATFERWSEEVIGAFGGNAEEASKGAMTVMEIAQYFFPIVHQRRAMLDRGEQPPDDLLTAIISEEVEGRPLTDAELAYLFPILIVGGNETTASFLATAVYQLCAHPDQLALLYDDPALIPHACEEILRYDSASQVQFRLTTRETELSGVDVPADTKVGVMLGAANRDPRRFTDPDRLNFGRSSAELRRHLGFGTGIHACVGTSLARLLIRIAFETLLARLPELRFDDTRAPVRKDSLLVRTLASVPVRWDVPA